MNRQTAKHLLANLPDGKIGILGDFCTDVYWEICPENGEPSIETGLRTTPVVKARYSPGGAGNIAANLKALGMTEIPCFGALGSDPFGGWLRNELVSSPDRTDFLLHITRSDYHSPVYCKPLLNGIERSRLDLGGTPLAESECDMLLDHLKREFSSLRVLIVNQQLKNGIHSAYFREKFAALMEHTDDLPIVIFDGRDHLSAYPGTILKINRESASILAFGTPGRAAGECGKTILARTKKPLVITDGEHGCHVFEPSGTAFIGAIPYQGPTDTVGAGDSFCAGFALALAAGAELKEAAEFGNVCSGVTIRKINQTGVPAPDELLALLPEE